MRELRAAPANRFVAGGISLLPEMPGTKPPTETSGAATHHGLARLPSAFPDHPRFRVWNLSPVTDIRTVPYKERNQTKTLDNSGRQWYNNHVVRLTEVERTT